MAKLKGGFIPLFGRQLIVDRLNQMQQKVDSKTLMVLQYHGEEFVNKARSNRTYEDDTGNLRSSIGYIILHNGKVINQNFKVDQGSFDGDTGRIVGMDTAAEVAKNYPDGWVLIGVAGMNYAAAVEALGYDVITGSEPKSTEIKQMIGEIQF